MPEMLLDHQLQGFRRTGGVSSHHGVSGHDLTDRSSVRVKTICSNLFDQGQ